jgi:hypothetical protein
MMCRSSLMSADVQNARFSFFDSVLDYGIALVFA